MRITLGSPMDNYGNHHGVEKDARSSDGQMVDQIDLGPTELDTLNNSDIGMAREITLSSSSTKDSKLWVSSISEGEDKTADVHASMGVDRPLPLVTRHQSLMQSTWSTVNMTHPQLLSQDTNVHYTWMKLSSGQTV